MARILAFSDLAWGTRERGAPGGRKVDATSFLRRVGETDPAIVVFAGDGAYDRCSRSGLDETELFLGLLWEIAAVGRHCVIVEGNNDNTMGTYGRVREAAEESPRIHEISGKAETVQGIRFLGVPTGKEKRMAGQAEETVDIVVAHAPLANRVWLFDLPAACIVTGHCMSPSTAPRPRMRRSSGSRGGGGSSMLPGRAGLRCARRRGSPRPDATRRSSGT